MPQSVGLSQRMKRVGRYAGRSLGILLGGIQAASRATGSRRKTAAMFVSNAITSQRPSATAKPMVNRRDQAPARGRTPSPHRATKRRGPGMLMLVELARRRTDQPQSWALVPAVGIGVVGIALLVLGPCDRVLGRLGWIWPLLLALVVVWSVRGGAPLIAQLVASIASLSGIRRLVAPSLLAAHSRPSWRRRRATTPRPAVAPTSPPTTACICAVWVRGLRL
jgi:hypothetical protein